MNIASSISGRVPTSSSQRSSARHASVRPQFRSKVVCQLHCTHCNVGVCRRGMKAILLADTNIELFSTDTPPYGVQLVNDDYVTRNCQCRIKDAACLGCGNVVGYHVSQPCEACLDACNNGHFWMFHMGEVVSKERLDGTGSKPLLWANLPYPERDAIRERYESLCR
ncbi:FAM72 protein-domain-containing protein [Polychytrium aggregatum]|uniref:FAM72 protein-domain-containing protein n=1 Tax=Polychytrium aggregatum TaxID=110093 RepID=UPI0022FE1FBF|nr:FAM72 protein-domain-containing protein [Polychytrium aggregatum]KAI9204797.1 FAM72 protein-domain-containing protein [Polychytrium aggregatum]